MTSTRARSVASERSHSSTGWHGKSRGVAAGLPFEQKSAPRPLELRARCKVEPQPPVVDYPDVNAELGYTAIVESVEEFLYQKELRIRA